jgi:hypothetical protein
MHRLGRRPPAEAEAEYWTAAAAVTATRETPGPDGPVAGGNDDSPGELDPGDEDYYAGAFEVLP